MVNWRSLGCVAFLVIGLALTPRVCLAQQAAGGSEPIASRVATVDGLTLHYLIAGHGPAVVLLHGYAETSRM